MVYMSIYRVVFVNAKSWVWSNISTDLSASRSVDSSSGCCDIHSPKSQDARVGNPSGSDNRNSRSILQSDRIIFRILELTRP